MIRADLKDYSLVFRLLVRCMGLQVLVISRTLDPNFKRRIDICHETVRLWVERFVSKFAEEISKNRAGQYSNWQ